MTARLSRRIPAVLMATALGLSLSATTASATDEQRPPFYEPPRELPAANGDLVRSEPAEYYLDPLKTIPADADVERIMYRSTDGNDEPTAITGTVITPSSAWTGEGPRPVIGYAPGTQGLGDHCAPSRQLANGTEYEGVFVQAMLAKGYAVAMTDYEGLGTPGTHTYVNREVSGHAVLDVVRAAQRLPHADLPADGPVALYGYSQGGGATASAAELAGHYAPELDIRGAAAGAVPAELGALGANLEGGLYSAFLGYAAAGLAEGGGIDFADYLNEDGEQYRADLEEACTVEAVGRFAFTDTSDLTEDGRPLTDYLDEQPFAEIVADQRIGRGSPDVPVLLTQSRFDDVIAYEQTEQLAQQWCASGADVQFAPNLGPTHVGGVVAGFPRTFRWIDERLAGEPSTPNCGQPQQAPTDPAVPYDENRPLLPQMSERFHL